MPEAGAPAAEPKERLGETLLTFLIGVFCFIPKEFQGLVGAGTFNIGVIDLLILVCLVLLAASERLVFRFSNRPDMYAILAFFFSITASLAFTEYPYFTIKAISKVAEATVLYLYFVKRVVNDPRPFLLGLVSGAVISLFLINRGSTDSKIHSAAYMVASIYFMLAWASGRRTLIRPFGWPAEAIISGLLFFLSFAAYTKKGAMLSFLVAILLLHATGMVRLRIRNMIALSLSVPFFLFLVASNENFSHQMLSLGSFLSGGREGGADSDYVRVLQFLAIPYMMKTGTILGYGYSQAGIGIDEGMYAYFVNIARDAIGFVPRQGLLNVGSNFFSDNIYVTLFAELGFLCLILLAVLCRSLWFYWKRNRALFIYIVCLMVFSVSIIDIFIYRGTGIFFLNACLFALLSASDGVSGRKVSTMPIGVPVSAGKP